MPKSNNHKGDIYRTMLW